jgi:hypothetical protein
MKVSSELHIWWLFLCAVTAFNIAAWCIAAWLLGRRQALWPADSYKTRRQLLWLSAAYVLGCGFRSVLPMVEVPNICLHDVWLSRIAITRSISTFAEICFVLQWALLLREAGAATGSRFTLRVSRLLVPIIVLAELFCWYAVLTTTYLPHALENAHWTLAATLTVAAFIALWPRVGKTGRRFLAAAIVGGSGYVAFMVIIDVPMYLSRWQADLVSGREARSLLDGLHAVLQGCGVQNDWAVWREDAVWLSLYFTFGVWASIALAHFPTLRRAPENGS